jgi:hypothetical protein
LTSRDLPEGAGEWRLTPGLSSPVPRDGKVLWPLGRLDWPMGTIRPIGAAAATPERARSRSRPRDRSSGRAPPARIGPSSTLWPRHTTMCVHAIAIADCRPLRRWRATPSRIISSPAPRQRPPRAVRARPPLPRGRSWSPPGLPGRGRGKGHRCLINASEHQD